MKKLLLILSLISLPTFVFAGFGNVWKSSFTATADTAQSLCASLTLGKRKGILHGVCVENADAGTVKVYNSFSTAANPVAVIYSTAAAVAGCLNFDIDMSSGIVYTTSTNGTGVTFTYQCD